MIRMLSTFSLIVLRLVLKRDRPIAPAIFALAVNVCGALCMMGVEHGVNKLLLDEALSLCRGAFGIGDEAPPARPKILGEVR